jgi:type II secretory pathway component PulK
MALIVVMVAIFVLSILIGAFAYSMKVETRLAMNANREVELTWLGRSGVELARYILANHPPNEPYDSLNQKWAGGPGSMMSSNSPIADIPMDHYQIGDATISVKIKDLESKFNINVADEQVLNQALLNLVHVDAGEIPKITGSILDWIDQDDVTHINGAESDDYKVMDPPYYAKNRPIDDLSELLLVMGIKQDPAIYWGAAAAQHAPAAFQKVDRWGREVQEPSYPNGMVDLFTAISSGKVNINTAPINVLQVIPMVDENIAAEIIKTRSGPDGIDGTEDDTPFRNVGELINTGIGRQAIPQLNRYCDVRSRSYEVQVTVRGSHRKFFAIVGVNSPRDIQVLSFYWVDE